MMVRAIGLSEERWTYYRAQGWALDTNAPPLDVTTDFAPYPLASMPAGDRYVHIQTRWFRLYSRVHPRDNFPASQRLKDSLWWNGTFTLASMDLRYIVLDMQSFGPPKKRDGSNEPWISFSYPCWVAAMPLSQYRIVREEILMPWLVSCSTYKGQAVPPLL